MRRDAQPLAQFRHAGGGRVQRLGVHAVDDEVEFGGVGAQLADGDVAQAFAVGGDQRGLLEGDAGHPAEERVLSGHQGIGAGDGDDQRDAQAAADQRTQEAVGQHPVGVQQVGAGAAGPAVYGPPTAAEEQWGQRVGLAPHGHVRLHGAHVAQAMPGSERRVAVQLQARAVIF